MDVEITPKLDQALAPVDVRIVEPLGAAIRSSRDLVEIRQVIRRDGDELDDEPEECRTHGKRDCPPLQARPESSAEHEHERKYRDQIANAEVVGRERITDEERDQRYDDEAHGRADVADALPDPQEKEIPVSPEFSADETHGVIRSRT